MLGRWFLDLYIIIYNGCGWIQRDKSGRTQLMGLRNQSRRKSTLHTKLEALTWAMENMLNHLICQLFGKNCKDSDSGRGPSSMAKVFNIVRVNTRVEERIQRFLDFLHSPDR